jgi:hypothetical protein
MSRFGERRVEGEGEGELSYRRRLTLSEPRTLARWLLLFFGIELGPFVHHSL